MEQRRVGCSSGTAWVGLVLAGVAGLILTACVGSGSSGAASSGTVAVRAGDIEVLSPYLPDPPSPDVAAVYFTVRNLGDRPDTLVGASSEAAKTVGMHREVTSGSVEVMAPLPQIVVPPHGSVVFQPGHDHVMLSGLDTSLQTGQSVNLTLHFSGGEDVPVLVPVVAFEGASR